MERASAKPAAAFQIVFDTTSEQVDSDTGEITPPEVETPDAMWERIEQMVPRHEPAAAIAGPFGLTPPLDSDADEAWRTQPVTRFGTRTAVSEAPGDGGRLRPPPRRACPSRGPCVRCRT